MIELLFVCIGNSARSQMSEGFMRALGGEKLKIHSAGSCPADRVSSSAIKVMKEKDIDISCHYPKGIDSFKDKTFDYVISMGCEKSCPFVPTKKYIEWDIPDPKDKSIEEFRKIRDLIEEKIKDLIKLILPA